MYLWNRRSSVRPCTLLHVAVEYVFSTCACVWTSGQPLFFNSTELGLELEANSKELEISQATPLDLVYPVKLWQDS